MHQLTDDEVAFLMNLAAMTARTAGVPFDEQRDIGQESLRRYYKWAQERKRPALDLPKLVNFIKTTSRRLAIAYRTDPKTFLTIACDEVEFDGDDPDARISAITDPDQETSDTREFVGLVMAQMVSKPPCALNCSQECQLLVMIAQGWKVKELAELLRWPSGTVGTRTQKCRDRFRTLAAKLEHENATLR